MGSAWKNLERRVAARLHGKRNSRGGDFSQSVSDVQHNIFSIECKLRARLPYVLRAGLQQAAAYDRRKVPLLVVKQKGQHNANAYCILRMSDFCDLLGELPGLSESPAQQDTPVTTPVEYEEGGEV